MEDEEEEADEEEDIRIGMSQTQGLGLLPSSLSHNFTVSLSRSLSRRQSNKLFPSTFELGVGCLARSGSGTMPDCAFTVGRVCRRARVSQKAASVLSRQRPTDRPPERDALPHTSRSTAAQDTVQYSLIHSIHLTTGLHTTVRKSGKIRERGLLRGAT